MSISPVKSRRGATRQTEKTEQLITFRLHQEWFAVPIETVQKVIQMGKIYGDPQGTGVSLTNYQGQEILVIDVARRIFQKTFLKTQSEQPILTTGAIAGVRLMLLLQSARGEVVGLPIDSTPVMQRVPQSAYLPIPESYISQGNVRCISSTSIQLGDRSTLFLLDVKQLFDSQNLVGV
jgi:chemotaxis signal transduction protein